MTMSMFLLIGMVTMRIASTLAIVKVISTVFGAEAFGSLSHVIGVSALFYMFAGGGVSNGLIRSVAASRERQRQLAWLSAAVAISVASGAVLSILCVTLYFWGGSLIFLDPALAPLFIVIAIAQVAIGFGNTAQAFLSGIGNVRAFVAANALGSILAAGTVVLAIQVWGLWGAFLSVALLPFPSAILAVAILLRTIFKDGFSPVTTKTGDLMELLRFSGAMAVGVVSVPIVQTFMRIGMAEQLGWESVGHWQAVARISDAYMQVFGVLFINLMLPQLSKTHARDRRAAALRMGIAFLALFLIGTAGYYFFRHDIIMMAFSPEFVPAVDLMPTQSVGDFFKVGSWIVVYTYVAAGRLSVQIIAELAQAALTAAFFVSLVPLMGASAAAIAHALACAFVLSCLLILASVARRQAMLKAGT